MRVSAGIGINKILQFDRCAALFQNLERFHSPWSLPSASYILSLYFKLYYVYLVY